MTIPIELYKSDAISSVEEDALGRKPFIEAVANFIKSQATQVNRDKKKELRNLGDPLTIGIYGKWGYGKTSVINCVKTEVEKAKFFTAYYNPWMYNNEEDLVQHLFETIVSAVNVKEDIENRKELISKLKKYSLGFLKGFKARAKFGVPFTDISVSVGYDAKPLIEAIEKDIDVDSDETIYDVKEEINKVLTSLSNPIVIFIDDIDRLSKTEIYTLFKTVRLIADFKNIIYVLSFDDEMVAKSIKEKFADGTDRDGYNYLDKIVDMSLRMPLIEKDKVNRFLRKLTGIGLRTIPSTEFDKQLKILIDYLVETPRDCVRIANSIRFIHANLKKKISINDLILLECLRIKSNDLFEFVKTYYDVINTNNIAYFTDSSMVLKRINKAFNLNAASQDVLIENDICVIWRVFFASLFKVDILGKYHIAGVDGEGSFFSETNYYSQVEKRIYDNSDRIYNPLNIRTYFEFLSKTSMIVLG